tara:strand:+ start:169 stop:381 length:213 start_codon:yes stop_codon:yes gene_type:complete
MKRNINEEIIKTSFKKQKTENYYYLISSSLNLSQKRKFNDIDSKIENIKKKEKKEKKQETENDLFKWYVK